jgi:hypothetical protein
MPKIGFRECHFIKISDIDALIEELKTKTETLNLPKDYDLRIYKSVYGCCGTSSNNIIVEIIGTDEKQIKDIDLKVMGKLMDICQQKGLEYHACDKMEIA